MNFNLTALIVDSADLDGESAFWHHLLGGSLTETPTHHFLHVDGLPFIVIQDAPELPPQWPDGNAQQMHFDLATDEPATADQRVLAAGGRRLRPTDDIPATGAQGSRVYASPAGHPFCIRPA
ncbi:VOC family protein [Streptomyces sp. NPDC056512]|uniref:VOC family protein n=1 Tax=Streptomyces sp. NPDC056512 TaxID=3345846 RepID=UPI00369BBBE2